MGAMNYRNLLFHIGLLGGVTALPQDVTLLKNGIDDWKSPQYALTRCILQDLY